MRSLFSAVNLLLLPALSYTQANPNPFCSSSEAWFAPGTTTLNTRDCVTALQLFFNETDSPAYIQQNITLRPASSSQPSVSPSLSSTSTVSSVRTENPSERSSASYTLPAIPALAISTTTAEAKRYVHGSCVLAVNLRSAYQNSSDPNVIAIADAKSLEEAQVQASTGERIAFEDSDVVVYDELGVKAQVLLAACLSGQRGEAGWIVAGRYQRVVVLFAGVGGVVDKAF
ncbi:MAG: hypothetical protein LQ342_006448 [Letrouitia transgressa]|nr:MAG: hypothetical protein LQ342_006448 [Letrouitia transgressa]